MSKQSFGEALGDLAFEYGLDNVVCTAVDSDTGEGCTLIKGNNSKVLTMLAVATLKDITARFGYQALEEMIGMADKQKAQTVPDMEESFKQATISQKDGVAQALKELKKTLGL